MKKLLLSMALLVGISGAASALTVQDICKKYSYEGSLDDSYCGIFSSNPTFVDSEGYTMTKLSGEMTIVAGSGNSVVVKNVIPGAKDITATFDEAAGTLTFPNDVDFFEFAMGDYTYKAKFGVGEISYDDDGYAIYSNLGKVVGKFDAKGVLTLTDWMIFRTSYTEPFAWTGNTTYTPAAASVGSVEADNAPAVYYNLQGVRVDNPTNGVYILRQGSKVAKVVL